MAFRWLKRIVGITQNISQRNSGCWRDLQAAMADLRDATLKGLYLSLTWKLLIRSDSWLAGHTRSIFPGFFRALRAQALKLEPVADDGIDSRSVEFIFDLI